MTVSKLREDGNGFLMKVIGYYYVYSLVLKAQLVYILQIMHLKTGDFDDLLIREMG